MFPFARHGSRASCEPHERPLQIQYRIIDIWVLWFHTSIGWTELDSSAPQGSWKHCMCSLISLYLDWKRFSGAVLESCCICMCLLCTGRSEQQRESGSGWCSCVPEEVRSGRSGPWESEYMIGSACWHSLLVSLLVMMAVTHVWVSF